MNLLSKYIITVVLSLLLISSVTLAQNSYAQTKELKIDFPEITGWKKGEITRYPTAALGYSIFYESAKGGFVDIYVYHNGLKSIPNGIDGNIIKAQFSQAKSDIYALEKRGNYQNVKEIRNSVVTLGGNQGKVKSLYALFNYTAENNNLTSEIYLFGYKNNIIKIRASRLFEKDGTENKDVTTLLKTMDAIFSK